MSKKLIEKWILIGAAAGRNDGWMTVEDSLKDTFGDCRSNRCTWVTSPTDLVWADIDEWETTDHFNIFYGAKMAEDAKEDYDLLCEIKAEFWEGYLMGRQEIGIDIYAIAQKLLVGYEKEWKKWAKT